MSRQRLKEAEKVPRFNNARHHDFIIFAHMETVACEASLIHSGQILVFVFYIFSPDCLILRLKATSKNHFVGPSMRLYVYISNMTLVAR